MTKHGPDPIRVAVHLDDQPTLDLVLVRHGQQTPPVPGGTVKDQRDPPLTDLGVRQKNAVARMLADEPVDAVYCSNLQRAHQTGIAIAGHHNLEPTVLTELREIELGRDRPSDEPLPKLLGDDAWATARAAFEVGRRWDDFPFCEPSADFRGRVVGAIDQIRTAHPSGRVVVACHAGVINALVAVELGIHADFWFMPAHCSVQRLRARPGRMVVQSTNEAAHLVGELETY